MVEPDKYEDIRREVVADKLKNDPLGNREVIMTGNNDSLMYDEQSGRYFKGNINDIDSAVNMLNKRMRSEMTIRLNDLYNEIGLPIVKMGGNLGWDIDRYSIEIRYGSHIADSGEPCIVLEYDCTVI